MAGKTIMSLLVKLGIDAKDFQSGLADAETKANSSGQNIVKGLAGVGGAFVGMGAAAVTALGGFIVASAHASARVSELQLVNEVLANNAGLSAQAVKEAAASIRSMGIEAAISEGAVAKMIQANLDLENASQLARIAQDAAVISNSNSSDSFNAIIHGITTLNTEVLRNQGLVFNADDAFGGYAETIGKTANELDSYEKQAAFAWMVMEKGADIAGSYEAAMTNPIKQLGSLKRLFNDIAVAAGTPFEGVFSTLIDTFSSFVKWIGKAVDEGGVLRPVLETIATAAESVINVISPLAEYFLALATDGDYLNDYLTELPEGMRDAVKGIGKFFSTLEENEGLIVGVLAAIGAAIAVFVYTTVVPAVLSLITTMAPIIAIMALVGVAAYLLYEAWQSNFGGIRDFVTNLWETKLKPIFDAMKVWLKENIPLALDWLADKWENVLLPAIETVGVWIADNLIPVLETIVEWLWVNIPIAIDWLSNAWETILLPAIESVYAFIVEQVIPIFVKVAEWLSVNIPAAIEAAKGFWENVLLPALQSVWEFVQTHVIPLWDAVAELVSTVVGLAITVMAGIWENILLPAINAVWEFIQTYLLPLFTALGEFFDTVFTLALTALAGLWENVLLPAITKVTDWISDKLTPIIEGMVDYWNDHLLPIIQDVGDWISDKLTSAFDTLGGAVDKVTGFIKDMTDGLKNITLPAWLTPGSPTPFEIGLYGIGTALDMLNRRQLPSFEANLSFATADVPNLEGSYSVHQVTDPYAYEETPQFPTAEEIGRAVAIALQQLGAV